MLQEAKRCTMTKNVILPILTILLIVDLRADFRSGNFKISSFLGSNEAPLQLENDIIKGEIDSSLLSIDSINRITLRPGQLIMRKKIRSESYGFYLGLLDTAAFSLRPPLFSFRIPQWARLEDMLRYRFYRSPTESIGSDEIIIYFDNERIYTRFFSQLYYFRNGIWFPLVGTSRKPAGSIKVNSNPSGAEVFLDGAATGKTTPCTIEGLLGGEHSLELRLPEYRFFRKSVKVIPDSTTSASFELIADVDTVYIIGDAAYSLLLLPVPPVDRPYLIDDSTRIYNARVRLPPGGHRIQWNADERFFPLDTVIEIPEGRVVYFDYLFKLRYGIVRLVPFPADAEICIDRFGCGTGERIEELPAGFYRVNIYRLGFQKVKYDLHVIADSVTTVHFDLRQVADIDGDGYIDSIDMCPDKYGLFNGCPAPHLRSTIRSITDDIKEFIGGDSLTFGVSLIGLVSKTPTNLHFRNFVSFFSSGKTGGANNYRGITFLNSLSVMYRGLFGYLELGQWSGGLQYRRADTLHLGPSHIVYFDSLFEVEPRMYIRSTSIGVGLHYNKSWLNISYAVGYQWEDIVFDKIINLNDNAFVDVTFDNDWWFHLIGLEADFNRGDMLAPSIYCNFKFPFGHCKRTRWITMNAGFQIKIFTGPLRKTEKEVQ